mmetsp:Transcript_46378/g.140473  ORF Transcript_46378/g.140473 Transcript_46378/m.140473 type:complete len:268 (-) Transcript_46378:1206-2009(-)
MLTKESQTLVSSRSSLNGLRGPILHSVQLPKQISGPHEEVLPLRPLLIVCSVVKQVPREPLGIEAHDPVESALPEQLESSGPVLDGVSLKGVAPPVRVVLLEGGEESPRARRSMEVLHLGPCRHPPRLLPQSRVEAAGAGHVAEDSPLPGPVRPDVGRVLDGECTRPTHGMGVLSHPHGPHVRFPNDRSGRIRVRRHLPPSGGILAAAHIGVDGPTDGPVDWHLRRVLGTVDLIVSQEGMTRAVSPLRVQHLDPKEAGEDPAEVLRR